MERRMTGLIGLTALVGVVAAACGDDSDDVTLSDDATITYEFGDASVPPEYHRSYALHISKDEVHVVVDSYGDVVGEATEPVPAEVWEQLVDNVGPVADLVSEDGVDSCSGGTHRTIEIEDGGETVVATDFEVCDSNEKPADEVDGYVKPVIDAIPGWDELFAVGEQPG
jgi:hypothetical protein